MDLKPHATLTRALCGLLKITIAVTAVAVLAGFYDLYSYSTLPAEIDANETMLPSDAVTGIVGLLQFILGIITGITFLRWIYRSNKNLRTLSGEPMDFTPGWSVGWYFVPFANLVKPYQVMKEIWKVTHKREGATNVLVGWWWTLWLISNVLGRIAFKLALRAEDTSSFVTSAATYILSDSADVVLNIVALIMITRIGAAYSRNIAEPIGAAYACSAAALPPSSDMRCSSER